MPRSRRIPEKPDLRFIAESEREDIIRMWNAGMTSRAIGAALGRSAAAVNQRIYNWRRQGTYLRTGEPAKRPKRGRYEHRQEPRTITCAQCAAMFDTWSNRAMYCSPECKRAAKGKR
jgi:hypothetical protein